MRSIRKIIAAALAFLLLAGYLPAPVRAAEPAHIQVTYQYVNPLYQDSSDLHSGRQTLNAQPKAALAADADISAAADQLRQAIKQRQSECTVQIQTDGYDQDSFRALMRAIASEAEAHTGVPTEGDYIMWQYGGWDASASTSGSSSNGIYHWTLTYTYSYYTTAEEEARVDSKIKDVLKSLNVSSASDYEKVKAIYDYICANVTYDREHLGDDSYKKQFTAYAALIQGESVCQGYALLFYRLALELGVDSRLISGTSHGEGHGWNIVELGNRYYNADTTWDAGNSSYLYFLKCPSNFPDHTRDAAYDDSAFHKAYPMADSDYVPGTETECTHSYTSKTTDPTCTADGKTVYTCSKCGDSYTETIAKLGHIYSSQVTAPTCTEDGYTTHTCSRCGDSYTDSTIPATDHSYSTQTTEPSCTTDGKTVYTCSKCGDSYTETIAKLGHSYSSKVTAPTCTEDGYTTHTCSRCGDSYTDTKTAATGHSWDGGTVTKEPTETAEGVRTYTCTACKNTRTEAIPKLEPTQCQHSYAAQTTEPTCTADGKTVYTCSKCGNSYTETIAKLGHSYSSQVIAPTCTEDGYTTHTCSRCGDSYTDATTAATGHSWDGGTVTKEPTETAEGVRTYTCTACKNTRTEAIPKLEPTQCQHSYAAQTTEPSCTTDGKTVYTCSKCGDSYTETIAKLGHSYSSKVTAPTCTEDGYTTHICSRCGDSYTDTKTAATGHSWDGGTVTKEPTETEEGVRTYTCTACKNTRTEAIPKLEPTQCQHSYDSVVTEPTCTAGGYTTHTCSKCGHSYTDSETAIVDHSYTSQTTQPTCTTEGQTVYTCTACGDSYTETIAKLPHQWDEGTVTKEPTATEAGEKTQHCANCDNVRITKLPATGKVLRLQGDNRYETAFKAADLLKVKLTAEKFNCIVVASGTGFADALPGSYLASQNQAPILLVNKHTVQKVADYIFENTYSGAYVYILGGEAAVPSELDALLKDEFTVRRLAGANRYETNLLILKEAGVATEDVLVCTGRDFADSLSVSALRRPILLVNKVLSDSQKEWLATLESNNIYVIGGANAVSEAIEKELAGYSYGYVERISGSNRYETSIKVAEKFFPAEADNLVLAYGQNFPDGLCGGVLAYNMNAPLILTRDKNASLAADFASARGITTGAVMGGPSLISDSAIRHIFAMGESDSITLQ